MTKFAVIQCSDFILAVLEIAYYFLVSNNNLLNAISIDLRLYIDAVSNKKENLYLRIRW
jgi:hypothetical protein